MGLKLIVSAYFIWQINVVYDKAQTHWCPILWTGVKNNSNTPA